jgi:hypothetical protein
MRAEMAGRAMVAAAKQGSSGTNIYEYQDIANLAS